MFQIERGGISRGHSAVRERRSPASSLLARPDTLAGLIYTVRGERVMLSHDLADLYGVPAKALTQAYRRNLDRFPPDFAFQLTHEEAQALQALRSHIVTLSAVSTSSTSHMPSPSRVSRCSRACSDPRAPSR